MIIYPHQRELIEKSIWLNNKGQIVVDTSASKFYDELQSFIEDNIVDSPNENGEDIYWAQVWRDYEEWLEYNKPPIDRDC